MIKYEFRQSDPKLSAGTGTLADKLNYLGAEGWRIAVGLPDETFLLERPRP